jgi:hypothetical protein
MDDKQIKVKKEDWDLFKEYADRLAKELNMNISIPNALRHAVKKAQAVK